MQPHTWEKERLPKEARLIPRRTAPLSPTPENMPVDLGRRLSGSGQTSWALFWAGGRRSIADIAERVASEETAEVGGLSGRGRRVEIEKLIDYFAVHAELGYVELQDPDEMTSKKQLVDDLRKLGVKKGIDRRFGAAAHLAL